jgi:hypothetical protein
VSQLDNLGAEGWRELSNDEVLGVVGGADNVEVFHLKHGSTRIDTTDRVAADQFMRDHHMGKYMEKNKYS